MSPEQAEGQKDLDFRADIYSLGATMFKALTGRAPHEGKSASAISSQIKTAVANQYLTQPCSLLIQKLMAYDREYRQQSWEDVIRDINLVANGLNPAGFEQTPHASRIENVPTSKGQKSNTQKEPTKNGSRPAEKVNTRIHAPINVKNRTGKHKKFDTVKHLNAKINHETKSSYAPVMIWSVVILSICIFIAIMTIIKFKYDAYVEKKTAETQRQAEEKNKKIKEENQLKLEITKLIRSCDILLKDSKYDEAETMVRNSVPQFTASVYENKCNEVIDKILSMKHKAVKEVMDTLNTKAEILAKLNDYKSAANLYIKYRGDFTKETEKERLKIAKKYLDMSELSNEQNSQ